VGVFNATVQLYVPVPEKPLLWLEMVRNPRCSNFVTASLSRKVASVLGDLAANHRILFAERWRR
jgi:hypothetical protein